MRFWDYASLARLVWGQCRASALARAPICDPALTLGTHCHTNTKLGIVLTSPTLYIDFEDVLENEGYAILTLSG
ncbi:hypothetical protein BJ878DRAFT_529490 [Calycina marina]|uniref:Uncharacterized protein n=1 Tax=Calycina marina TaxID=1763456 RepID=A0A9P7YU09_9HELO|nr:hypothetical protein BJ878DRAFT_529490 [Calycina marina]